MRLFHLTASTIFRRKAWAICAFAVVVLPFVLPLISTATERLSVVQPARIQAAWASVWVCTLLWGLYSAARQGEANSKSGLGEYFLTTGVSATRQWLEIWLAVMIFVIPLAILGTTICLLFAMPADPQERGMWWVMNLQYLTLFSLAIAPLLGLSIALASRFGGIVGFAATLCIAIYGLWGVGYIDRMLKLEPNPILHGIWQISPQYRWADLTQRLYFKSGAIEATRFWQLAAYFAGILAVYCGLSRLCFRVKSLS
ncbi:hypothetical protein KBB96_02880 [Luteolibacter ambystomatis]|uniref:Uncharacterized protein n=1 Tax=Luteolibacter ambystomatis TaxID=2824561 RepID=A0A975J0N3_9BACT|nr:hypothetical protein [Luteolibacter ambystomatis]QUE51842.1 hypothetical protein KBB96_02880 [Luteolibacter ambystomatis]